MKDINANIQRLITPAVQKMNAYHVSPAKGLLKLDAMENPYVWDESLKQKWLVLLQSAEINRYPNPSSDELRKKIVEVMDIPKDLDVMLGNGSDEIIQILAMALATENASMLSVEPSFVMYKVIADVVGMKYHSVLLNEDFTLNLPLTIENIIAYQPNLLFFAVPNNPTGNSFSEHDLRKIIEVSKGLVVIDEAYIAFTETQLLQLAMDYDNVLIMRTLSKVGLAGLRLGMLIGKPAWINELNKLRLPYNINVLTQYTTLFALENYKMLVDQAQSIKVQRHALSEKLMVLKGVEVFPSQANFILIRTQKDAKIVFQTLKDLGVLIKCLSGSHSLLQNCLRITVSTEKENNQFLVALKQAL